jgi:hypothetical protein
MEASIVNVRIHVIFSTMLSVVTVLAYAGLVLGEPQRPSDEISLYPGICLDPGHGGPGACQYLGNPPGCMAYGSHEGVPYLV